MGIAKNNLSAIFLLNKSKIIDLKTAIKGKYQSFQAPFSERQALLVSVDSLLILWSVYSAFWLQAQTTQAGFDVIARFRSNWYWVPILLGSWWVLAWLNDLYDIPSSTNKNRSIVRIIIVDLLSLGTHLIIFLLIPNNLSYHFFLYLFFNSLLVITLWRWTYIALFKRFQHRVLIVGRGKRGQFIANFLKQASHLNYQIIGYVDEGPTLADPMPNGLPVLGEVSHLPRLTRQFKVGEIVIANEKNLEAGFFEYLVECQAQDVRVSLMPDLYERLHRRVPIKDITPDWGLQALQERAIFNRFQLGLKRLLDLVLATLGLIVLTPFLPLVMIAIHLDSRGPIFYRQIRCGRAGKPFYIIKFRTMVTDAEQDGNPRWATENDTRITRVGRFLRKTRLDEVPQLINVLKGEMSIIGPRPERPEFVTQLQQGIPFYSTRTMVKPGLTGWAQIHYDYGNSTEDALIKLEYDFYYLRHWSLWLDLYIIFQTFGVVFKLKGT
ncbi:MAG: exopolysaccharide biosynthesis polyprenyl glycosylphosphotransferase [Aliifodinibius sp.]|nr:sugar transferase [Fodinibius sp.]NIW43381.1 exopolysaccharide biosynthesis polyprenyl glycosylphosphotransferase [Gammaproteobacteria bacterium]NIW97334.1 exopolysaccharide biosynthesis polyprenyl glycosylphosphotransferase [Phycisphaerae bacterium]NIY23560.1 exopolysaccharide biosynthesis polyprenyl glycosylphosphotransferase [Fodinibius sp.]